MINEKDVKYVADLARMHLKDDEIQGLTKDLGDILGYINKLESLDITDIPPTSHAMPIKNVFREDVVTPSLGQEKATNIAIEKHNGAFKVPKIIE
ncbi:Asp-tRNA(Asn)/Glu-tRNA(Gln) amidotransferase subunit GatC [Candidatus Omnitrophota bacterium]